MAGLPQQAPRQSRLAIHNRQRPRQAEETVPSVRVTRATSRALNLYQDSSGSGHALNTVGGCPASDPRGGRHRPCLSGCPVSRALFGAGDSQHRLNIDLVNVFAAWTDAISSVKRPALGIECTVRRFGTLEALRSFSYLSCHSKVISLTCYDQRVPSWSELKLGVLRTQQ